VIHRFIGFVLRNQSEIFNNAAFNQVEQPRQAESISQLQQIEALDGRDWRNLVCVQIAQQLVECVNGNAREYDLR